MSNPSRSAKIRANPRPILVAAALTLITLLLIATGYWQGTAAPAQLQVPMFYDAHYLFPRPWTQEHAAPGVPDPAPVSALYGPNRISQPFVAGMDRLSMIRLWLAGPEGTPVQVSLADENGPVYAGEVTVVDANGSNVALTFDPIPNSKDRTFTLTLHAPDASADAPVSVHAVGGDRLGGSFYLNEYPRPGNLDLATYGRGWPGRWWLDALGEQLLPDPFLWRIQQYKPAPFKGALFPALLTFTLILTGLFLIAARPGTLPTAPALAWGWAGLLAAFLIWQALDGRLTLPWLAHQSRLQPVEDALPIAPEPGRSRLVHDLSLALWTAGREPEAHFFATSLSDGQGAIVAPPVSVISYPLVVPPGAQLRLGMAIEGEGSTIFRVRLDEEMLLEQRVGGDEPLWAELDLSPWAGQARTLRLETGVTSDSPALLPSYDEAPPSFHALWLAPQLTAAAEWLLEALPDGAEPVRYTFGDSVELAGYQVSRLPDGLDVMLYWRALSPLHQQVTVFVHLLDGSGNLVAQHDGQPVLGSYPLPAWQPGAIIADSHFLPLSPDQLGEDWQLTTGLYDPDSLARWPVHDSAGALQADGRALLPLPTR